jgi:hypothetical protein
MIDNDKFQQASKDFYNNLQGQDIGEFEANLLDDADKKIKALNKNDAELNKMWADAEADAQADMQDIED